MGLFHRIQQFITPDQPAGQRDTAAQPHAHKPSASQAADHPTARPANRSTGKRSTSQPPANRPAASRHLAGQAAETAAIAWLQQQGLALLERNYKTPGRGGGEIDAIMRADDGTLVFVEVRLRTGQAHGGAAASVHAAKQRRIVHAAQHYLQQFAHTPACRFDVMACDSPGPPWRWTWLVAAFDAA